MCAECEHEAEAIRPHLNALIDMERAARIVHQGDTEAQHTVRLACTVVDGYFGRQPSTKELCIGFALAVEKLLAVQEVYGIPVI